MIKNICFMLCLTLGLMLSTQGCIKKKETPTAVNKATKPTQKKAQIANNKTAARKKANNKMAQLKAKAGGKPVGYWPQLRKHLGIDADKLGRIKTNEVRRMTELTKPGAKKVAINTKYDNAAKSILGAANFSKMQSFKFK